jgi:fumarylacetoacetase
MQDAEAHVFGLTLFNDWSARDIQGWEYQPLGPFLSKNFASTVSPWMVTLEALAPFRQPFQRPAGDPDPLPYLDSSDNRAHGAIGIQMEVALQTAHGAGRACGRRDQPLGFRGRLLDRRAAGRPPHGQRLRAARRGPVGSGTLSGADKGQSGSLLELTTGGKNPITLSNGERRGFLEDGDTIILRAYCEREGARRIGFGECRGTVLPCVQAEAAA